MNQNDPISKKHASGSGSAHLRFAMFGARGPCMDEHNDGSASAGSGTTTTAPAGDGTATAATPPPSATTQTQQTAPAPAASRVTFTAEQQVEVNRIAAEARDQGRRAAASSSRSTTAPAPAQQVQTQQSAPAPTVESVAAELRDERLRREFAEYAADFSVPRPIREDMFALYRAQNPGDPNAWFEQKRALGLFAVPQAAGSTATTATTAASITPGATAPAGAASPSVPQGTQPPPAIAPSAPASNSLPMQNGIVDIFACTPAQLAAMGPQGVRTVLDQLSAIGQQLQGAPQRPKVPQRQ